MDQLWQTSPHEPAWQSSPVPSVPTVRSSAILSSATASLLTYTGLLQDLSDRFDAVVEAIEAAHGWVTNRVTPGKIILGELGGIEAGVRQLKGSRRLRTGRCGIRGAGPSRQIRDVKAGLRRADRNLAVPPVDVNVRIAGTWPGTA